MSTLVRFCLSGYARAVSPFLHQFVLPTSGCRFFPTCSAYGADAVRQYGLAIGFMLLLRRLGRCHPWSGGGYDPPGRTAPPSAR